MTANDLYFPLPNLTGDGRSGPESTPPTSLRRLDTPGLSIERDRAPAERIRGAELAAAIVEWLFRDSDLIMVDDDGEEPVRLDTLLEAIYELQNDAALVRRLAKFLALILTTHRWPMTVHGTAAVPPQRVTNLLGVQR